MSKQFTKGLLVALLSWTSAAFAAEWFVEGLGTSSCGKFVSVEDAMFKMSKDKLTTADLYGKTWVEEGVAYEEWVLGFVSASNLARPNGTEQIKVDRDGTLLWVKNYCQAHPDESLVMAAGSFVKSQRDKVSK